MNLFHTPRFGAYVIPLSSSNWPCDRWAVAANLAAWNFTRRPQKPSASGYAVPDARLTLNSESWPANQVIAMANSKVRPHGLAVVLRSPNRDSEPAGDLSGLPGRRDWYANVRERPQVVVHLRGADGVSVDVPASARPVTDRAERERVMVPIARLWRMDLGLMVRSSPLIEIVFSG